MYGTTWRFFCSEGDFPCLDRGVLLGVVVFVCFLIFCNTMLFFFFWILHLFNIFCWGRKVCRCVLAGTMTLLDVYVLSRLRFKCI